MLSALIQSHRYQVYMALLVATPLIPGAYVEDYQHSEHALTTTLNVSAAVTC